MIYGIEQTTDMRDPDTKIRKFSSLRQAERWAKDSGGFAWNGAVGSEVRPTMQNFHRRMRAIYQMPHSWRPPSKRELGAIAYRNSTSTYPCRRIDALASAIYRDGEEVQC
jgi:hypothetical protein